MLSVSAPSNIPGKRVTTSNRIDLQQTRRRVYFDDASADINPSADGAGEWDQDLLRGLALDEQEIRPARPQDVRHAPDSPVPGRKNLKPHEAENIIGALREVNQILT